MTCASFSLETHPAFSDVRFTSNSGPPCGGRSVRGERLRISDTMHLHGQRRRRLGGGAVRRGRGLFKMHRIGFSLQCGRPSLAAVMPAKARGPANSSIASSIAMQADVRGRRPVSRGASGFADSHSTVAGNECSGGRRIVLLEGAFSLPLNSIIYTQRPQQHSRGYVQSRFMSWVRTSSLGATIRAKGQIDADPAVHRPGKRDTSACYEDFRLVWILPSPGWASEIDFPPTRYCASMAAAFEGP